MARASAPPIADSLQIAPEVIGRKTAVLVESDQMGKAMLPSIIDSRIQGLPYAHILALAHIDGLLKGLERPQPLPVDAIAGRVVPQQQTIHPRQISLYISQYVPIRMVEDNDSQ